MPGRASLSSSGEIAPARIAAMIAGSQDGVHGVDRTPLARGSGGRMAREFTSAGRVGHGVGTASSSHMRGKVPLREDARIPKALVDARSDQGPVRASAGCGPPATSLYLDGAARGSG